MNNELTVLNRLKRNPTWANKMKLRFLFNVEADNDPAEGSNSGEPPYGEDFA